MDKLQIEIYVKLEFYTFQHETNSEIGKYPPLKYLVTTLSLNEETQIIVSLIYCTFY